MSKYSKYDGVTTIELSGDMLKSMGVEESISRMEAIHVENSNLLSEFSDDIAKITESAYKLMMSVNNDGNRVKIYTRKLSNGEVEQLLIYTSSSTQGVCVRLAGSNIQLQDVGKIISFLFLAAAIINLAVVIMTSAFMPVVMMIIRMRPPRRGPSDTP